MKLVAILGKKRSGKDTLADYVCNDFDSIKWQLALPIKMALDHAYSVTFNSRYGYPKLTTADWNGEGIDRETPFLLSNNEARELFTKALNYLVHRFKLPSNQDSNDLIAGNVVINNNEPWSIRRFMQTLGTDIVVDRFDRMFWIKIAVGNYLDNYYSGSKYFVIPDVRQQHEIDTLRSMGATVIHVVRPDSDQSNDTHITEAGLKQHYTDSVILNTGTVEDLYSKFNEIMK